MTTQLPSDQKLAPGMQLYLVSNSNRTAPKFVTVTKVGRKWATIDDRHRVDLKTLEVESGGYSPWAKCWLRKEDYDASVALEAAWREFRRMVDGTYSAPPGVTINQIANARRALFKVKS